MKISLNYLTTKIHMVVGQQLKYGSSQSDLPMHSLSLEEGRAISFVDCFVS